jgi:hypothetical protein
MFGKELSKMLRVRVGDLMQPDDKLKESFSYHEEMMLLNYVLSSAVKYFTTIK